MIRILFIFSSIFYLLIGCAFITGGAGTYFASQVGVIVAPFGEGDEVLPKRPLIFLKGGDFSCRPKAPTEESIVEDVDKWNISDQVFQDVFGIEVEDGELRIEDGTGAGTDDESEEAITESVSDNWLKLGLLIGNKSDYFLVIEDIVFTGVGTHKKERFTFTDNISSGYCGSNVLYTIPPKITVRYKPRSSNSFENLTLYVDGFEIIDRTEDDNDLRISSNPNQQGTSSGSNASFGREGLVGNVLGQSGTSNNIPIKGDQDLLIIPDYSLRMILLGYFLTPNGSRVASFRKSVIFSTQSSLE